jgi:hypothetical protein
MDQSIEALFLTPLAIDAGDRDPPALALDPLRQLAVATA